MKKQIIILLFFFFSAHAKDIILWDLHDVLLKRCGTGAALWTNIGPAFANMSWAAFGELLALFAQQTYREISSEEMIKIAQKHHIPEFKDLIFEVGNAQCINPGMDKLVQELDSLGIDQHLGSNIGRKVFEQLRNKKRYPEINRSLLDYLDLSKSKVVQYSCHGITKKPNPAYFEEYLAHTKLNPKKDRIIFVDDKLINVMSAKKMGLIGIQFKNSQQLREELQRLGIKVQP